MCPFAPPCTLIFFLSLLSIWFAQPAGRLYAAELSQPALQYPNLAQEMIDLINSLRNQHGLASLNVNSILMQNAQAQADYLAAGGTGGHLDELGRRPFQRALDAGYPVAGDLSLGGYFSENFLTAPLTPQEAVDAWLGDDAHTNTMLSPYRSDLGVGVAFDGMAYFYVVDTGLRSIYPVEWPPGATALPNEEATESLPAVSWVIQDTPLPDGSIMHVVRQGEALWSIAAIYGMTVEQVLELNQMSANGILHPNDRLTIRLADTATPIIRPTYHLTRTPMPSSTHLLGGTETPNLASQVTAHPDLREKLRTGIWLLAAVVAILLCISLWQGAKEKSSQ
jgi:uncharacterized protein YkwD